MSTFTNSYVIVSLHKRVQNTKVSSVLLISYRVIQWGSLSSHIFNLMVDDSVHEWLKTHVGKETATAGVGEQIYKLLIAFDADDGLVQSQDPVFLQEAFVLLVALFEHTGLGTNTTKT